MTDEEMIKQFNRWSIDKSCLHCLNWEEKKEICQLFKQRPPARVIVIGCQYHDFIPF